MNNSSTEMNNKKTTGSSKTVAREPTAAVADVCNSAASGSGDAVLQSDKHIDVYSEDAHIDKALSEIPLSNDDEEDTVMSDDVLESRKLNVESEWKRIVKPRMSIPMANWTRGVIDKHPANTGDNLSRNLSPRCSMYQGQHSLGRLLIAWSRCGSLCSSLSEYLAIKGQA
ncbi:hypothetical protein [Parasitella parasitica]|uniref:Uncharacterized protein n=1 Tax=Parasitella parasitica TaxID=35722 RepID=A0A0B7N4Y5_9FUNG|nr:hypothetical protein [Parasitella parasitica]